MTPATEPPGATDERTKALILAKLDRATAAHEKTRAKIDGLIADAREAEISLTEIEAHSPYSREWVRKIAARVSAERTAGDPSAEQP